MVMNSGTFHGTIARGDADRLVADERRAEHAGAHLLERVRRGRGRCRSRAPWSPTITWPMSEKRDRASPSPGDRGGDLAGGARAPRRHPRHARRRARRAPSAATVRRRTRARAAATARSTSAVPAAATSASGSPVCGDTTVMRSRPAGSTHEPPMNNWSRVVTSHLPGDGPGLLPAPGAVPVAWRQCPTLTPYFRAQRSRHERGLHRRSRPHPGRQASRRAVGRPPGRPRRARHRALVERTGVDPTPSTTSSSAASTASARSRSTSPAPAALTAGLPEHVPGVTIDRQCGSVAAGGALRRAGRHVGHPRPRHRGRRAEHEHDPDRRARCRRRAFGFTDPFSGSQRLGRALRRPGDLPVPRRRADRRAVGHHPRRHGGVRDASRTERALRAAWTRGASTARSRRSRGVRPDEGLRASPTLEKIRLAAAPSSRAAASPPRCRARSATVSAALLDRLRGRGEDARPHAAGADPPPERARRRPDVHAHRADPRHRVRARRRPA